MLCINATYRQVFFQYPSVFLIVTRLHSRSQDESYPYFYGFQPYHKLIVALSELPVDETFYCTVLAEAHRYGQGLKLSEQTCRPSHMHAKLRAAG